MWFGNVVFGSKALTWLGDNPGGKINFVSISSAKKFIFSQIRLKDCRLSLHFKNKTDVKKALFGWIWGYAERAKTRYITIKIKIKTACFHKKYLYVDVESTKNASEFFFSLLYKVGELVLFENFQWRLLDRKLW